MFTLREFDWIESPKLKCIEIIITRISQEDVKRQDSVNPGFGVCLTIIVCA